jgi:hypothetical protein
VNDLSPRSKNRRPPPAQARGLSTFPLLNWG